MSELVIRFTRRRRISGRNEKLNLMDPKQKDAGGLFSSVSETSFAPTLNLSVANDNSHPGDSLSLVVHAVN